MAAVITTTAEHSYAYDNAIILHHELSYGIFGNLAVHKKQVENAQKWSERLLNQTI